MKILSTGSYYGAKKSELSLPGVLLSEYTYLTPQTDWHYHENPYFMYVLQGNLLDVNKKHQTPCPAGSLIFHNWQEAHFNQKDHRMARGFHIELTRNWFEQHKWDIDLWEGSQLLEHPTLHHIHAKLYYEFKCKDAFSPLAIELLLLQLCEGTHVLHQKHHAAAPTWIQPLKELLHHYPGKLSLAFLSQELGVHPVHLSRAIPKYLSTSLGDYIRQHKVRKALSYMMDTNYSLTEIAYLCGFSDQSHFVRTFKNYFHTTPKVFRAGLHT